MMRYLLRFNWPLALCAAALTVLGVIFIGSAGAARSVAALQTAWRSHAFTAIGGFALMFALAFLVRTFISSPLVDMVAPKLVLSRFDGVARSIGMTVINVVCTAPIMCALATLLLVGTDGFLLAYLTKLPIMALIAAAVNFFIVGPVVKIVYNRIAPADGLGLIANLRQNVPALTQLLGF